HCTVDLYRPPGEPAEHFEDTGEAAIMSFAVDEGSGSDGTGIDHRIKRTIAPFVKDDRIESFAARFDPDFGQDIVDPELLERQSIDKRLGDRLDREKVTGVAELVNLAIRGRQDDAEKLWVDPGKLRDVGSHLAVEVHAVFFM